MLALATGSGAWFAREEQCKNDGIITQCFGPYNKEVLDKTETVARFIITALAILQVLMVICCFKWRQIGAYLIHLEMAIQLIALFFPNSKSYHENFYSYMLKSIEIAITSYCGQVSVIYLLTVLFMVQIFFGTHVAYMNPLTIVDGIFSVLSILFLMLCLCFTHTTLHYLQNLHTILRSTNEQSQKLLNGMHEGLLILQNPQAINECRSFLFCNKPAQKLLNGIALNLSDFPDH